MEELSLDLINEASAFLKGRIAETPIEEVPFLSKKFKVPVYFKLEFLQTTGSFKLRGALFTLSKLSAHQAEGGVVTCSAGNHGWALAHAGRQIGVPVTVYTPASVDRSKESGIRAQGATVFKTRFPGYDEAERFARAEAARLEKPFISPFDEPEIMAANGGTIAREVLDSVPDARTFLLPVGGGGLSAGFGFYAKSRHADSCLIACQHLECPALQLSLECGQPIVEMPPIETVAGGIEGGIGVNTFSYLRDLVDHVELASEKEIYTAVRWILEEQHYLVEPSSAVAVSPLLRKELPPLNGPVVVVLTGRNVALETLRRIIC